MRRWMILLAVLAALSLGAAAETAGIDAAIDGVYRYGSVAPESGETFYFDTARPVNVMFSVYAEVTGSVHIYRTDDDGYVTHFGVSGRSDLPQEQQVGKLLSVGRYRVSIDGYDGSVGRVGLKLSALPMNVTEAEPNDVIAQAQPLEMGRTLYAGMSVPRDTDCYRLQVDRAGDYTLDVGGYMGRLDCLIYASDGFLAERRDIVIGGNGGREAAVKETFSFSAGTVYLCFKQSIAEYDDAPFYSIKLNAPPKGTAFFLPAGQQVTQGFSGRMTVRAKPEGTSLPPLAWTSADPGIASVDGDGVVAGHRAGKVKITCADGTGASASCVLTVRANRFSRSKPAASSARAVCASTKKLAYQNGDLYAEIFLVNRSRYVAYLDKELYVCVRQLLDQRAQTEHGRIIPLWDAGLFVMRPGARKVLKVRFPAGSIDEMDLAAGTCEAVASGFVMAGKGGARVAIQNVRPEE